ncbi:MAG TPA: hypothetical protein VK749_15560 [Xanthobacteraceae bacterium]|jgi:hypothetical protein|nr:hypothetical protein [Xanthobacteraceae bacterium]
MTKLRETDPAHVFDILFSRNSREIIDRTWAGAQTAYRRARGLMG